MGYIYVELFGVMEYFFDGLWGYQVMGYYVLISCLGSLEDFKYLVNYLYLFGIGVLFDWVLGYFFIDEFVFVYFDGLLFYEYVDLCKGYYYDWNIYIFDYGCNEVVMFLIGLVLKWVQDYYVDGLWVDVVVFMLYLDFLCIEWVLNIYGGCENFEVIVFFKCLNEVVYYMVFGCLMIVEESMFFFGVIMLMFEGLGFDYKWVMGWMNDLFVYFEQDLIYCKYDYYKLIFFNVYWMSENYVLVISYDEVVYFKKLMVFKYFGDWYVQCVDYCVFFVMMWIMFGKKLLFMGQDFVQGSEWNYDVLLLWFYVDQFDYCGVMNLVWCLNEFYCECFDWYMGDVCEEGMVWISVDDIDNLVYVYVWCDIYSGVWSLVIVNLILVYCEDYVIGVFQGGEYCVLLFIDDGEFGGFGIQ